MVALIVIYYLSFHIMIHWTSVAIERKEKAFTPWLLIAKCLKTSQFSPPFQKIEYNISV